MEPDGLEGVEPQDEYEIYVPLGLGGEEDAGLEASWDTTGDGRADFVEVDTSGDGRFDAARIDTTRDGRSDHVAVDTSGDRVYDHVVVDEDRTPLGGVADAREEPRDPVAAPGQPAAGPDPDAVPAVGEPVEDAPPAVEAAPPPVEAAPPPVEAARPPVETSPAPLVPPPGPQVSAPGAAVVTIGGHGPITPAGPGGEIALIGGPGPLGPSLDPGTGQVVVIGGGAPNVVDPAEVAEATLAAATAAVTRPTPASAALPVETQIANNSLLTQGPWAVTSLARLQDTMFPDPV